MPVAVFRSGILCVALLGALAPGLAQGRNSVTLCQTLEPPILDPTGGAAAAIREITYDNIFETLLAFNGAGKLEPRLATRWSVSPDGRVYTFSLRKGVTFHDGAPFSAKDVIFSFERARAPDAKNTQKWIFAPIERMDAPDEATLVITLNTDAGNFPDGLAWADAAVFSERSVARAATEPVGTGPYAFVRWARGDRVVLKRYSGYWGPEPAIETAQFRFITDPQAQIAALQAGDCDAHTNIGAPEAVPVLKANPNLTVTIGRTEGETILAMNNARAPFNALKVRQAIAMAIDRDLVNAGALSGLGTPIGSHFSPNHPAYLDLTGLVKPDVKAAKALLAEAGYRDGFSATLRLPPPAYARRSGEIIAAMLNDIGITLTIEPVEWPQWLEKVYRNRDYDLTIVAHVEPLDINIYARDEYYFGYRSEAVKAAIAASISGRTQEERYRVLQDAQRLIARDQVNVFLFMLPKITVANVKLKGMWVNWPIPANPLASLRWE